MLNFDLAQTFYVSSASVDKSSLCSISSVDLYFYAKPAVGKSKTGIRKPGVTVYICRTKADRSPDLSLVYHLYSSRVEYDDINVSTTGATRTRFDFEQPVSIPTNRMYGLLIQFDGSDNDFKLWINQNGKRVLNTSRKSTATAGKVDGNFFTITNGSKLNAKTNIDLTCNVNVAKFTKTPTTFKVVNAPYELLTVANTSVNFRGGESVYKVGSSLGTVNISTKRYTVTGSGFSDLDQGDAVVITDGTPGNTEVRIIDSANSTVLTLTEKPSFTDATGGYYKTVTGHVHQFSEKNDYLIIKNSTANSTYKIAAGDVITGVDSLATTEVVSLDNYNVHSVVPNFVIKKPASTTASLRMNFANTTYGVNASTEKTVTIGKRVMIPEYPAALVSRSEEITVSSTYKSFRGDLTFATTNQYVSPYVMENNLDLFVERYLVGNNASADNEYLAEGGTTPTRYISKTVTLNSGLFAEDLKVFARVFKPSQTGIKVYARVYNTLDDEAFETKNWTPMTLVDESLVGVSNKNNIEDLQEIEFAIPTYHTGTRASGTFTTTADSAIVTGTSGAVDSDIEVGDVIRLYDTLFPANYIVGIVASVDASTFTLQEAVPSGSGLVGSGYRVEVSSKPQSAFLDTSNSNLATYFNNAGAKFQTFNAFALKVVLTSEDNTSVPYVDDIRAIAVSA